MKGSTSCRRFCWLQVNFSYGHEAAASRAPTNGCSWPSSEVHLLDYARVLDAKLASVTQRRNTPPSLVR
jgi:hypothetical protein